MLLVCRDGVTDSSSFATGLHAHSSEMATDRLPRRAGVDADDGYRSPQPGGGDDPTEASKGMAVRLPLPWGCHRSPRMPACRRCAGEGMRDRARTGGATIGRHAWLPGSIPAKVERLLRGKPAPGVVPDGPAGDIAH